VYWEKAPLVLEEMFSKEQLDFERTKRVDRYLTALFAKPENEQHELMTVGCRGALCKVVCRHEDEDSLNRFRDSLLAGGPLDTDSHGNFTRLDDGRLESTMYVSREGGDPETFFRMNEKILALVDSESFGDVASQ
jgi:hypothetical protein